MKTVQVSLTEEQVENLCYFLRLQLNTEADLESEDYLAAVKEWRGDFAPKYTQKCIESAGKPWALHATAEEAELDGPSFIKQQSDCAELLELFAKLKR